jgi:hypothetical protein
MQSRLDPTPVNTSPLPEPVTLSPWDKLPDSEPPEYVNPLTLHTGLLAVYRDAYRLAYGGRTDNARRIGRHVALVSKQALEAIEQRTLGGDL